jgi:hydrogenase expression/formation protein HypC
MCLGLPGRIVDTTVTPSGIKMGRVRFAGTVRDACLLYVPDAVVGDYVVVHLGFAINRLEEAEALRLMADLAEIEGFAGSA